MNAPAADGVGRGAARVSVKHISELVTLPTPTDDDAQREHEYRVRESERKREDYLRSIGVPSAFWPARFSRLTATPAMVAARKFYEERAWERGMGGALILAGPTGTGKTMASCALIAELLPDLRTSQRFTLASALSRRLLDYRLVDEAMSEMTRMTLLVIDDLCDLEPRALALIEEVLIVREAEELPVVVTSNLTPARLNELLSDRVVDRLRTWGEIVECRGASLRKRPEATTT